MPVSKRGLFAIFILLVLCDAVTAEPCQGQRSERYGGSGSDVPSPKGQPDVAMWAIVNSTLIPFVNLQGVGDYDEDSDNDGISNGLELEFYHSNPYNADTDDDGIQDGGEAAAGTDLTDSCSPYIFRAIDFAGSMDSANTVVVGDRIDGKTTGRLSLQTWTIELAVRPDTLGAGVQPLVSRCVEGTGQLNYELGLTNGFPYACFDDVGSGRTLWVIGRERLSIRQWTHLAGRFDGGSFVLFLNGESAAVLNMPCRSAQGVGDLVLGAPGFDGQLRDVRIWKVAQSDQQIRELMNCALLFGEMPSLAGCLKVSGGGHLKENATTLQDNGDPVDLFRENWTLECWVRTEASGRLIARRNKNGRTEDDFNYFLGITLEGTVCGRFAAQWSWYPMDPGLPSEIPIVDFSVNDLMGEIKVNDGNWHHVAYVRDDLGCRLFVDGLLDAQQHRALFAPPPCGYIDNWEVRALPGPCIFGEDLAGNVDEIRTWNRGLSRPEVESAGGGNLVGSETGLVTYIDFDFLCGATAGEGAVLRDPLNEYGVYIGDAVNQRGHDGPPFAYNPLLTLRRIGLAGLFTGDDGGLLLEDFTRPLGDEPFCFQDYAGRMGSNVVFVALDHSDLPYDQDSDSDGLPDGWEYLFGREAGDPGGDPDYDGLSNLYEYLAGTCPRNPCTEGDGTLDYYKDADGDGLANGEEQDFLGTDPGAVDTDDDGYSDGEEPDPSVIKGSRSMASPVHSRSPATQRSMVLTGGAVVVPGPPRMGDSGQFDLSEWTLECRVRPQAAQTGSLIERVTNRGQTNFALCLIGNVPHVQYTTDTGTRYSVGGAIAIPANEWSYLAGVFDPTNHHLALHVNGVVYHGLQTLAPCATGAGRVTLGGTVLGYLDQVRIWDGPLSFEQIHAARDDFGWGAAGDLESGAVLRYRFEDVGVQSEAVDASGNGLDGTITAGAWTALGAGSSAVSFTGSGYVDAPADDRMSLTRENDLTVGLWWRADDMTIDRMALLSKRSEVEAERGLILSVSGQGSYRLELGRGHWVEFRARAVGARWNNLVLTKKKGDWRLFHNGVEIPPAASAGWPYFMDVEVPIGLRFGGDHLDRVPGLIGAIAGVEVHRHAMAPVGVSSVYAAGSRVPAFRVGRIVAWFPFDDGGSTAEDYAHPLNRDYAIAGATLSTAQFAPLCGDIDTDGDHMPDWWESLCAGGNVEPDGDPDRDGLSNLYEYYGDTSPFSRDTDGDTIPDFHEERDGDGLVNGDEQRLGTDPLLRDTDDDGTDDLAESNAWGIPTSSLMHLTPRALKLAGSGYVEMPLDLRFALESWTIEAWVNPAAAGGTIVERSVSATEQTFRLRLAGNRPTIEFNGASLSGPAIAVSGSHWTHVAATYDAGLGIVKMYYASVEFGAACPVISTNSVADTTDYVMAPSPYGTGPVVQRIGQGFNGWIDEVRIWDRALSAQEVADRLAVWLEGNEPGLVAYYRFDDSTSARGVSGEPTWTRGQVEDFVLRYSDDWWQQWRHAATCVGVAGFQTLDAFTSPVPIPLDLDQDGLPDWFEQLYAGCLDWTNADSDGDGIPDYFDDQDGDGVTNYEEYRRGTDPGQRDTLRATPASPMDMQVGDVLRVTLCRPTSSTDQPFFAVACVSDMSLLSLMSVDGTPRADGSLELAFGVGVASYEMDIAANALGNGVSVQDGWILVAGEDLSVLQLRVRVHAGEALELGICPSDRQSVVVGDTAAVSVTRVLSRWGVGNMPLTLNVSCSAPESLGAPESLIIPAGTNTVQFLVAGLCEATNSVFLSVQAPGYPGSSIQVRVEMPRFLTIAESIASDGDNGLSTVSPAGLVLSPGEVRYLVAYRPHNQAGSDLVLDLESADPSVFTVDPSVLTIPGGQQGGLFSITGVAGGTNLVRAAVCGQQLASAMIGVSSAIVLSGPSCVTVGDIAKFNIDIPDLRQDCVTVRVCCADAWSVNAVRFLDAESLVPIDAITVPPGVSRVAFAVEGLKVHTPVNIAAYVPDRAITPGGLSLSVVAPGLAFDEDTYSVGISNCWPFALSRRADEAGGWLMVSLTSSRGDVCSMPDSVWFAPGQTTVGGLIRGGTGGGAVSNAVFGAEVEQVLGADLQVASAQVILLPKTTSLVKMRWYDTDLDRTYSSGDRLEFVFNAQMAAATVSVTNMRVMASNTVGSWNDMEFGVSYVFGTGHGAMVVSNGPTYAVQDSHFFVTLGSSPHIHPICAIDPSDAVIAANGDPDMTWPPVRFPRYPVDDDGDGDGLLSEWEEAGGLDPCDRTGDNGWYGDPDRDGLINGYEFLATWQFDPGEISLLDPRKFDSDGDGVGDYGDRIDRYQLKYGELFDDADLLPDWWEAEHQIVSGGRATTLDTTLFSADDDEDGDGWSNLDEFLYEGETNGVAVSGTDPSDPSKYPEPRIAGDLVYDGTSAGDYHVLAYGTPGMDGIPLGETVVTGNARVVRFEMDGLPKGDVYLYAYKGGSQPQPGNPWGIPDKGPIRLGWSGVQGVTIGLNDAGQRPSYPILVWTPKAGVPRYRVSVYREGVLVLKGWVNAPRSWFLYRDYQTATYASKSCFYGLRNGNYSFKVRADDKEGTRVGGGKFAVKVPGVAAPRPVSPAGSDLLQYTTVDVTVSNLNPVAALDVRLTLPSEVVTNFVFVPPWRSRAGLYTVRLPVLLGDGVYSNGTYGWDARAFDGSKWTGYSTPKQTFIADVGPSSRLTPSLGGEVRYAGCVPTNLVVEVFLSPDFSGAPVARFSLESPSASTRFVLGGLRHAVYYVRAYFDGNRNGVDEPWESQAFARASDFGAHFEYWDTYAVGSFDLTDRQSFSNVVIVVRDRDADSDRMPDAWEMKWFGSLERDGRGDFDSDGLADLQEYACGSVPTKADTDRDGLGDGWEVAYGLNPLDPER